MSEFKKGDLVECIDASIGSCLSISSRLLVGEQYKVLFADDEMIGIDADRREWCNSRFKKVKEKQMEYKVIKPFSIMDIYKADPCKDEFEELLKENFNNYDNFDSLDYIKKSPVLKRNLEWLEGKGFIEKVKTFEPFDLVLKVENADEMFGLWHRLNRGSGSFYEGYCSESYPKPDNLKRDSNNLWKQVDKEMWRVNDK